MNYITQEPDDVGHAKAVVRAAGYSLVSQRFIINFAEFIQDWRKGDFDLPELAALDVEACFEAWQEEKNNAEVAQPATSALAAAAKYYAAGRDDALREVASATTSAQPLNCCPGSPGWPQPLTDTEIESVCVDVHLKRDFSTNLEKFVAIARAIESAHGITASPEKA